MEIRTHVLRPQHTWRSELSVWNSSAGTIQEVASVSATVPLLLSPCFCLLKHSCTYIHHPLHMFAYSLWVRFGRYSRGPVHYYWWL